MVVPRATALTPKPSDYYGQERGDLIRELAPPLGRVLDVGCGEGASARLLRDAGATAMTGIELHPPAAERAQAAYDHVITGRAEDAVSSLDGPFDTILCYDVLEHLPDPDGVLHDLRRVASPRARLHVSVPNARHFSLVRDLVVRGTFGYTTAGHRDSTHLRWFTRRDIVAAVESAGWRVLSASHPEMRTRRRLLHSVTRGQLAEFTYVQWVVLAVSDESPGRLPLRETGRSSEPVVGDQDGGRESEAGGGAPRGG